MGDFEVLQRTKDGMFNATSLLKQWNKSNNIKRGKEVNGFLKSKPTKEFMEALAEDENLNTNQIVLTNRGKKGGTWMHPYLFIDFAMWLNPKFKLQVIKFVYDQLIEFRHDAGDNYKGLTASATKLKGVDYSVLAKALNWIVFGIHGKGLRQTASQEELKELAEVQKKLAFSIDMGMIRDFDHLLKIMRKMYDEKHNKAA
ncbi:hypothetical protein FGF1_03500 [Flavobacteriaceae bacterium GF1]